MTEGEDVQALLDRAKESVSRMSLEKYKQMLEAQKASFVRYKVEEQGLGKSMME